jgi:hypothetical protein
LGMDRRSHYDRKHGCQYVYDGSAFLRTGAP